MTYAIDSREAIQLGGVTQYIRIRSMDENLPLLLFLHGGPGVCDRHWVLKYQSGLSAYATMVCYDQRGAGLSYDKKAAPTELTVEKILSDTAELCTLLKERFHKEKVFIVGHSWGSLLGVLLAQKYPGHVAAYIGMGQFVDGPDNERLSYEFVLEQANARKDQKAIEALTRIGVPVKGMYKSRDDLMVQRNYMNKYGGGDYNGKSSILSSMILPLIKTPEYSLLDLLRYANGAYKSLDILWPQVVSYGLRQSVPSLEVPVYLTQGRHDQNTPVALAEEWFNALRAPYKELIWFEEAAHSPIKEMPEQWGQTVIRIIKEVENRKVSDL